MKLAIATILAIAALGAWADSIQIRVVYVGNGTTNVTTRTIVDGTPATGRVERIVSWLATVDTNTADRALVDMMLTHARQWSLEWRREQVRAARLAQADAEAAAVQE